MKVDVQYEVIPHNSITKVVELVKMRTTNKRNNNKMVS
jgi:hypothetical protein